MRISALVFTAMASLTLGACVSTLADVAKAPFEVAGKAVDLATTSQSEADESGAANCGSVKKNWVSSTATIRKRRSNARTVTGAPANAHKSFMRKCR